MILPIKRITTIAACLFLVGQATAAGLPKSRKAYFNREALVALQDVLPEAKVEVALLPINPISLDELHKLSETYSLPVFHFRSIYIDEKYRLVYESEGVAGENFGQDENRWRRTVCAVRIDLEVADASFASRPSVRSIHRLVAPVGVVRKLIGENKGRYELQSLEILNEESYSMLLKQETQLEIDAMQYVPAEFDIPSGCENYATKIRGVSGSDYHMGFVVAPKSKDMLKQLASERPNDSLALHVSLPSRFRFDEISGLVKQFEIASLTLTLNWGPNRQTLSRLPSRFEFSSYGPDYLSQLQKAICSVKATNMLELAVGNDGKALEILTPPSSATIELITTAKEAKRLSDNVQMFDGRTLVGDRSAEPLNLVQVRFEKSFSELVRAPFTKVVPTGCDRYVEADDSKPIFIR